MKKEFLEFLKFLMDNCTQDYEISENVQKFIDSLKVEKNSPITETGKNILLYLRTIEDKSYKAKDIAEGLFISSRSVSGAMRKLILDGYIEKTGQEPVLYKITNLGKEVQLEKEND